MAERRSIEIDSFKHSNPVPAATRIGPLVVSSIIVGRDPGRTTAPDDLESQLANLYHHVGEMLEGLDADWRHIVKMTFFLPSLDDRAALNAPWVEHFPDAESRPSRYARLGDGDVAQCEFIAFVAD